MFGVKNINLGAWFRGMFLKKLILKLENKHFFDFTILYTLLYFVANLAIIIVLGTAYLSIYLSIYPHSKFEANRFQAS